MDAVDRDILIAPQRDGRQTNAHLAEQPGLSAAATLERVQKLERDGALRGYHAEVASEAPDVGLQAFVAVELKAHSRDHIESFERGIARVSGVKNLGRLIKTEEER